MRGVVCEDRISSTPIRAQTTSDLSYRKEELPITLESYTKTYPVFVSKKGRSVKPSWKYQLQAW